MKTSIKDLYSLLSDFISSLDNRSDIFLIYNPLVLEKLLRWNKISWQSWLSSTDESDSGTDWCMIYSQITEGIRKIGKRSISAGQYSFTVPFLKDFVKHLSENEEVKAQNEKGKTWLYISYAYRVFFELVIDFVSAGTHQEDYMWENFPDDWEITSSNLKHKKIFAILSYDQFINWAMARIQVTRKEEFDLTLHNLTENLFPEVDAKTWEIILIFICSPYDPEARVKSVIQRYWTIGRFSLKGASVSIFTTADEATTEEEITKQRIIKQRENEEALEVANKKTFELALQLFPDSFSKELLFKYIAEANNLKYDPKSHEENKRAELLRIFMGLAENVIS